MQPVIVGHIMGLACLFVRLAHSGS